MAIQAGDLIKIAHYNDLASEVNRLYSDNTVNLVWETSSLILDDTAAPAGEISGENPRALTTSPTDGDYIVVTVDDVTLGSADYSINYGTGVITFLVPLASNAALKVFNREIHRYGWGQQASVYPILEGNPILADEAVLQAYLEANTNNLIDKTNVMEDRTGGPTELTRLASGELIRATDKLTIISSIDDDIIANDNYYNNVISTVANVFESFTRVTDWDNILIGEWRYSFTDYDSFRYFFNSGCQLRLLLEMTGNNTNQGYWNWSQVVNDMGSLIMNWSTCSQSGINGISSNLGAYDLTPAYQTIFTSGSPSQPVDDNGMYDSYGTYNELRVIWEARIIDNTQLAGNLELDIRATMDDMNLNTTTVGTTTFNAGYLSADDIIDNSATFSIASTIPTIAALNDFESGDDS